VGTPGIFSSSFTRFFKLFDIRSSQLTRHSRPAGQIAHYGWDAAFCLTLRTILMPNMPPIYVSFHQPMWSTYQAIIGLDTIAWYDRYLYRVAAESRALLAAAQTRP
jgi:hypothetical protein